LGFIWIFNSRNHLKFCNLKRRERPEHPQVSVWPPWTLLHSLQDTNSLLFPWLVTTQGLLCRTTQCNFRSHRWSVRTSCLTTQKRFGLWPQIEHLQCTCTARHHGQTPFDFTNQLLVFYFTENTPTAQASRPSPSSNLSNCS
jgi:hypothetical protein